MSVGVRVWLMPSSPFLTAFLYPETPLHATYGGGFDFEDVLPSSMSFYAATAADVAYYKAARYTMQSMPHCITPTSPTNPIHLAAELLIDLAKDLRLADNTRLRILDHEIRTCIDTKVEYLGRSIKIRLKGARRLLRL